MTGKVHYYKMEDGLTMRKDCSFFEMGVVAVPDENERYCYPCSLVLLPDGRLMTTFTQMTSLLAKGRYWACVSYSSDGGKSWTEPEMLFSDHCPFEDFPEQLQNFADPNVAVFDDKIVAFCVSLRYDPNLWDLKATRVWYRISENSGKTWSPIREKKMHKKFVSGMNHPGLRLRDNSVILGYSWDKQAESGRSTEGEGDQVYTAGVLRTVDKGTTWIPGGDVFVDVKKGSNAKEHAISGADEPTVVELNDGSLYMLVRTGTDRLWESRSTDLGASWSPPVPTQLVSHNCPASLLRLKDGDILVIYNNHPKERARLSVRLSQDQCLTWTVPKTFAPAGFQDQPEASYPVLCQLGDETIVAVWGEIKRDSQKDRFKICYARFNKEWIQF